MGALAPICTSSVYIYIYTLNLLALTPCIKCTVESMILIDCGCKRHCLAQKLINNFDHKIDIDLGCKINQELGNVQIRCLAILLIRNFAKLQINKVGISLILQCREFRIAGRLDLASGRLNLGSGRLDPLERRKRL